MPPLKPYSSDLNYSYAPGVFPSLQLMQNRPEKALRLLLSEKAQGEGVEKLRAICREYRVREEVADKALSRISGKQNCFAAVVFVDGAWFSHPERIVVLPAEMLVFLLAFRRDGNLGELGNFSERLLGW